MVAIGWTAWCAVTNSNPWPGSYWSPVQTRPRLLTGSRVLRGAGGPLGGADAVRRVPPSSAASVRSPASSAACFTQFRIACAEGSNWRASSSGVRPLRTSSTIRWRNSGEYGGLLFGIVDLPFRPNDGVSTKPGQLQSMVLRWSEDRGQPPCSIAVAGHRLSFVLPEALDFEGEPRGCDRGAWVGDRVGDGRKRVWIPCALSPSRARR